MQDTAAALTDDDRVVVVDRLRELRAQRAQARLDEDAFRRELQLLLERRRQPQIIVFPDRRQP